MMRSGQVTTELKRSFAIEDGKEPTSVAEVVVCGRWVGTAGRVGFASSFWFFVQLWKCSKFTQKWIIQFEPDLKLNHRLNALAS